MLSSPHVCAAPEFDALFLRITQEYGPRIRAYIQRIDRGGVGTGRLFEDLLGEIFLACVPSRDEDDLWPPILAVLRRCSRQRRQIERRERVAGGDEDYVDDAPPDTTAWRLALWDWERGLLSGLPETQRAALEWHVMDEMNDAAIADRLGIPIGRVRVLRHRAARKCREHVLSGRHAPPPDPR